MLGALRVMTVQRGIDPRAFALMPFGGAGPLHAAALARELGIERILCPRASGVLCALGLAAAAPRRDVSRTVMLAAALSHRAEPHCLAQLAHRRGRRGSRRGSRLACASATSCAIAASPSSWVSIRATPATPRPPTRASCARRSPARTSCATATATTPRRVELVNIRVSAWGPSPPLRPLAAAASAAARETRPIVFDGRALQASVHRGELAPGTPLAGPALCALKDATLLLPPGWSGEVDAYGTIQLRSHS